MTIMNKYEIEFSPEAFSGEEPISMDEKFANVITHRSVYVVGKSLDSKFKGFTPVGLSAPITEQLSVIPVEKDLNTQQKFRDAGSTLIDILPNKNYGSGAVSNLSGFYKVDGNGVLSKTNESPNGKKVVVYSLVTEDKTTLDHIDDSIANWMPSDKKLSFVGINADNVLMRVYFNGANLVSHDVHGYKSNSNN